ncbi:DLW-39 family protein [Trueperella bonasi]|uniref:DLW-39 family protein n=1 Tax=Trueperella bonasi TaxID=312286 RepID=UPI00389ADDE3
MWRSVVRVHLRPLRESRKVKMRKFLFAVAALMGGVVIFLRVQENLQRQAVWQQVTDPVDF